MKLNKIIILIAFPILYNPVFAEPVRIAIDKKEISEKREVSGVLNKTGLEKLENEIIKKEPTLKDLKKKEDLNNTDQEIFKEKEEIKEVESDTFEEVKRTGASFWGSLKNYGAEKIVNTKEYLDEKVDQYYKAEEEAQKKHDIEEARRKEVKKQKRLKEEKKVLEIKKAKEAAEQKRLDDLKKVSFNDHQNDLVSKKRKEKAKKKEGLWQDFRVWMDPEAVNIRKGEEPEGKSIGN